MEKEPKRPPLQLLPGMSEEESHSIVGAVVSVPIVVVLIFLAVHLLR